MATHLVTPSGSSNTITSSTYGTQTPSTLTQIVDYMERPRLESTRPVSTDTVTKYQFRQLFTLQERISIDNAQYNITLSGSQKAAVVTILKDLTVADEIQLSNPEVAASLLFMSVIGLVTEARVDRILINAPPY